jgi:mannan endo-1,4-beta-mannosidase
MHSQRMVLSFIAALLIFAGASLRSGAAASADDNASTDRLSTSWTHGGLVSLSAPTYTVAQNSGSVTISVNRTSGSRSRASVNYATADSSAIAGINYTSARGTLNWGYRDTTPKSFVIPISNAAQFTGTKILAVAIAGAQGAALGTPTSAIVTINADGAAKLSASLSASPTSVASGDSSTLIWSSTNAAACTASGGWAGSLATSGSQSMDAITATKTYALTCTGSGGSATQSATVSVTSGAPAGGTVARPSYNTGNGFFVLNGRLYDPNGNEFRMRGVDRNHYDSNSSAGIAKSGANTVRIFAETNYGASVASLVNIVQTQHINQKEVPIPASSITTTGTKTSGSTDPAVLGSVVANWVATASSWTALNKYQIINIANEWGPSNSTVWRDSYISAIASMRAAGYSGTLLIDSGGWGQDPNDLLNYSTAVFNSDPQKNVMFAFHFYGLLSGYSTVAEMNTIFSDLAALSASQGMVFAITEFGPGKDIGPSPTMVTPGQVITAAEAYGLGWLAWAWDDNDLAGCMSDNNWFSMTYSCGAYTQTSDLTAYGQDIVLNPTYGLMALAKRASIF